MSHSSKVKATDVMTVKMQAAKSVSASINQMSVSRDHCVDIITD